MISRARVESLSGEKLRAGMTNFIYPSTDRMWRDTYAGDWRPVFYNQQWGGAQWGCEMVDGATGQLYKFDVATGYVQDDTSVPVGYTLPANSVRSAEQFKVSDNLSVAAVWVKVYKTGNPSVNINLQLSSDNAGVPGASLGSIAISPKLFTSKTDGEWVRFQFATPLALTANSSYWVEVFRADAGVDGTNYVNLKASASGKYPHGVYASNNGSSWATDATKDMCFLIEPVPTSAFFRPGGQFDGKLVFSEGVPLNQSKALINRLRNFFDPIQGTLLHRVGTPVKGKPIADYLYGLDHDRILLMCDSSTGYASVRLWEKDGTLLTLTGNSDISGLSFADIALAYRAKNDGADYLELVVNGVVQASVASQSILFDTLMRDLGHVWLGGGFPVVAWTQKLDMTSLPSANGWTYSGTATEANAFSISGGKLYQNKNGFASGEYGIYTKTGAGITNATGGSGIKKVRIPSNTNTPLNGAEQLTLFDGSRAYGVGAQEYFLNMVYNGNWASTSAQADYRSVENVLMVSGKGNDLFTFMNGRIVFDGTGINTAAVATASQVIFGDNSGAAGENADVVYDYVAYTNSGPILPQIATGMALHEYAAWSGDKSTYLPALYNGGSPIAVKVLAGLHKNYVEEVQWSESRVGIVSSPSTTSTSYVTAPDLEAFVVGDSFGVSGGAQDALNQASGGYVAAALFLDGAIGPNPAPYAVIQTAMVNQELPLNVPERICRPYFGLHKVDVRYYQVGGTGILGATRRFLNIRSMK